VINRIAGGLFPLLFFKTNERGENMKIINKNLYKVMYGLEFINPDEVKEINDKKLIALLLNQPNVEEFVAVEDAKKLENDNDKLKKELELEKAKNKALALGIKFQPNIGLEKLLKKIEEAEKNAK
jgi:hypothetical protein